jgi:hypothetical protein
MVTNFFLDKPRFASETGLVEAGSADQDGTVERRRDTMIN